MEQKTQLNVWMTEETKRQFKVWAARNGVAMGGCVEAFIKQLLVGDLVYRKGGIPPIVQAEQEDKRESL